MSRPIPSIDCNSADLALQIADIDERHERGLDRLPIGTRVLHQDETMPRPQAATIVAVDPDGLGYTLSTGRFALWRSHYLDPVTDTPCLSNEEDHMTNTHQMPDPPRACEDCGGHLPPGSSPRRRFCAPCVTARRNAGTRAYHRRAHGSTPAPDPAPEPPAPRLCDICGKPLPADAPRQRRRHQGDCTKEAHRRECCTSAESATVPPALLASHDKAIRYAAGMTRGKLMANPTWTLADAVTQVFTEEGFCRFEGGPPTREEVLDWLERNDAPEKHDATTSVASATPEVAKATPNVAYGNANAVTIRVIAEHITDRVDERAREIVAGLELLGLPTSPVEEAVARIITDVHEAADGFVRMIAFAIEFIADDQED